MAQVGRDVCVTGHVQGVFFRAWTKQQADELGVSGWVRNCADGSVEAHLAGEESAVQKLIERLHQGPPSAVVNRVETESAEPTEDTAFKIRH